jgi:hypothetical protein
MNSLHSSSLNKGFLAELTTLGVDDWLFVANLEIALIMGVGLRFHWWFVLAIGLHFVLMIVTRLQPSILLVYLRYMRQSNKYVAAWSPLQKRCIRPLGWGRGEDF